MNPCQSGAGLQAAAGPGYDLLRRAGLYEVASHAGAINTTLNTVHLTLRANERAKRLSLPAAQDMQSIIERDATTVQNHAKEARRLLKEQLKGKTWQALKKDFDPRKSEIEPSLKQARAYWVEAVSKTDFAPDVAVEMVRIWDEAADALRNKGIQGIFDHLDHNFGEFERATTAEQDFGRHVQSPITTGAAPQLAWWQWLIIIALVGLVVSALVACLIWSGCAWILELYSATCVILIGSGGWVGPCLTFHF